MARYTLRLSVDGIGARQRLQLPPANRVLYLRDGDAVARTGGQAYSLGPNTATQGPHATVVEGGQNGATLLRFELVPAGTPAWGADQAAEARPGDPATAASRELLARDIELGDPQGYLMRADRVDFPLAGVAWTHTHRGPGIRCLLRGAVRIEAAGEVHEVRPGQPWFEAGPDPVLAIASGVEMTSFVRVTILPRELIGKSSIRYEKAEDADKPKTQRYQSFADEPITL